MSTRTVQAESDQARLYELIWKRTLASQMSDAQLERTNVRITTIRIKRFLLQMVK